MAEAMASFGVFERFTDNTLWKHTIAYGSMKSLRNDHITLDLGLHDNQHDTSI